MAHVIGLDFDGLIIDHSATVVAWLLAKGIPLTPEQTAFAALPALVSETLLNQMFDAMYEFEDGVAQSELMLGAAEGIAALVDQGHRLHIISRRNTPRVAITTLRRLGLWPKFFGSHNTHFARYMQQKVEIARTHGVTRYADDQPRSLTELMIDIPYRVLFDQFGVFPDDARYARVTSWPALVAALG